MEITSLAPSKNGKNKQRSTFFESSTLERVHPLDELGVCFLLWLESNAIALDCPDQSLLEAVDDFVRYIVFSHTHPDHLDLSSPGTCPTPVFMPAAAPIILQRLGKDPFSKYPNLQLVQPFETVNLYSIGTLKSLPFSHTDDSLQASLIQTKDNKNVLISPDNRYGTRSVKSIKAVREFMKENDIPRLDLVVFDATRIGHKPSMTIFKQNKQIQLGLSLAEDKVPTVISITIGDYKQVNEWIQGTAEVPGALQDLGNRKIFVRKELYHLFEQLCEYDPSWKLVINRLNVYSSSNDLIGNGINHIFITDDPNETVRGEETHLHINATRKPARWSYPDTTYLEVPAGRSGHDDIVTKDLMNLPSRAFAVSHPGGVGYKQKITSQIGAAKLVLEKVGETHTL